MGECYLSYRCDTTREIIWRFALVMVQRARLAVSLLARQQQQQECMVRIHIFMGLSRGVVVLKRARGVIRFFCSSYFWSAVALELQSGLRGEV